MKTLVADIGGTNSRLAVAITSRKDSKIELENVLKFKNSDFKNFEDWCVGIILIYKQKKKILLNKEIFYYVNYKKKKEKNFFYTFKLRFIFSKKFGVIQIFHSTISYAITQIFLRKFK